MRLLFFDLNPSGHHAGYLHHLILNRPNWQSIESVSVVVSPDFITQHADIVADAEEYDVRMIAITETQNAHRLAARSGLAQSRTEWNLMEQYARLDRADEVLLMYFDHLQPAFWLSKPLPFDVSGILFRPSFHYADWGHGPSTVRERLQSFRKRWLLRALLIRPELKNLFCLDTFAVAPINHWASRAVAHALPDPVAIHPASANEVVNLSHELGIGQGRKVVLVFGQLDERKGIEPLLRAFAQLTPAEQAGWCVVLAGPLAEPMRPVVVTAVAALTNVQVIRRHEFIVDEFVQPLISVADVVTVLYQQHIGMSGVLVRASAAGRPVLASDYGLIGQLVRTRHLGRAVDATNPDAIADALRAFGRGEWDANPAEMQTFAAENQAGKFADVIFRNMTRVAVEVAIEQTK